MVISIFDKNHFFTPKIPFWILLKFGVHKFTKTRLVCKIDISHVTKLVWVPINFYYEGVLLVPILGSHHFPFLIYQGGYHFEDRRVQSKDEELTQKNPATRRQMKTEEFGHMKKNEDRRTLSQEERWRQMSPSTRRVKAEEPGRKKKNEEWRQKSTTARRKIKTEEHGHKWRQKAEDGRTWRKNPKTRSTWRPENLTPKKRKITEETSHKKKGEDRRT